MTILLNRRTKEPEICFVCARRAGGIGVCKSVGQSIGWLCDDPNCIAVGQGVYGMNMKNLDRYEERALEAAGTQCFDDLFEALIGTLYSNNIRSLEEVSAEVYSDIQKKVVASPEYRRAFEKALRTYGGSLHDQLSSSLAPF